METSVPLYICIVLAKSKPMEISALEVATMDAAIAAAQPVCQKHPECTRYQLWRDGKMVHTGQPKGR